MRHIATIVAIWGSACAPSADLGSVRIVGESTCLMRAGSGEQRLAVTLAAGDTDALWRATVTTRRQQPGLPVTYGTYDVEMTRTRAGEVTGFALDVGPLRVSQAALSVMVLRAWAWETGAVGVIEADPAAGSGVWCLN